VGVGVTDKHDPLISKSFKFMIGFVSSMQMDCPKVNDVLTTVPKQVVPEIVFVAPTGPL
jgi:hypothetical protein